MSEKLKILAKIKFLLVTVLRKNSAISVKIWSYVTLFVCFWDFLTFVILGADYDKCLEYSNMLPEWMDRVPVESLCANIILPVFFIAAKGFVLWIINIVLALLVLRKSKQTISLK